MHRNRRGFDTAILEAETSIGTRRAFRNIAKLLRAGHVLALDFLLLVMRPDVVERQGSGLHWNGLVTAVLAMQQTTHSVSKANTINQSNRR